MLEKNPDGSFKLVLEAKDQVQEEFTDEFVDISKIDYDYETSGLNKFIAEILDDVDRENPDHIYQFGKLNICLGR